MGDQPDIAAYLERVGYAGSLAPTPETLAALVAAQLGSIPFETLDGLTGAPPRADLANLQQKLLYDRRGGSGIELNLLCGAMLADLDFQVAQHWAEVLFNGEDESCPTLRHRVLTVAVVGVGFLVDVGFGSLSPTVPLRLRAGLDQQTPQGRYRLVGGDPSFTLERERNGAWTPLYRFTPGQPAEPPTAEDLALAPGLHVAKTDRAGVRFSIQGTTLSLEEPGGARRTERLSDLASLKDALRTRFGIGLPPDETLDKALVPLFG